MVLMNFDQVRWLRARTAEAASGMDLTSSDAATSSLLPAYVPATAFGNTSAGPACGEAWRDIVTQARTANDSMRLALEADVTRLAEVIECFQSTDQQAADEICATRTSITVMSAHLHSHDDPIVGREASRPWDDYLRATQHDRLVDYAAGRSGAVLVGVDANVSIDRDADGELAEYDAGPLAPEAVERFEDEGFENVGDVSHGRPGEGTSSTDRSIDYVWSRGLSADPSPMRVEGTPSDHDGMLVEYPVYDW